MAKLALNGGEKVHTRPWPTWPVYDEREKQALLEASRRFIQSGRPFLGRPFPARPSGSTCAGGGGLPALAGSLAGRRGCNRCVLLRNAVGGG